jgi:hypothetical protein
MRIQEHLKLSSAAALVALPWLKQDIWIPFTSSILIDVDHYLWHAVTHRTLSLRAAFRYFGQAHPQQRPMVKFLHHPFVLGPLLLVAILTRSRWLWLILAGLLFHVSLDTIHVTQMNHLKQTLRTQADNSCPQCKQHCDALQLHTLHYSSSMLDRYNPVHFMVLCPACHEEAHRYRRNAKTMV